MSQEAVSAPAANAGLHPPLAARDLAGCAHRLNLDRHIEHPPAAADPAVRRRITAATQHREQLAARLAALNPQGWVQIPAGSATAAQEATRAAVAAGADAIWGAALPDPRGLRRGRVELLYRSARGYVPIIVVNHRVSEPARTPGTGGVAPLTSPLWAWHPLADRSRKIRPSSRDRLRLAQCYAILADLGWGNDDNLGGLIGSDADCIVVADLGVHLATYEQTLTTRVAVARGEVGTAASRVYECRDCPWWSRCEPELVATEDVSLVVNANDATALRGIGISTYRQLAQYRGAPPEGMTAAKLDETRVMGIARLRHAELIRRVPNVGVQRADIEIDVDMESFGEDGAYLWGTLLTDTTNPALPVEYRPFVTWSPLPSDDEARSFAAFWRWLMDQRQQAHAADRTFAAYCYSASAENRWLYGSAERFGGQPGIPTRAEVDEFVQSAEWVDVYAAVDAGFLSPGGKGLKKIAPLAGFHWRDSEAGGEASMSWYEHAVGLGGRTIDYSQRQRLLAYNEDDVRATKVLREWMSTAAMSAIPTVSDLLAS